MIANCLLLLLFLLKSTQSTSDVNTGLPASLTSEPESEDQSPKDARHLPRAHMHDQEPEPTHMTITSSSHAYSSTHPRRNKDLYTVDYQEASRRGKTDVTIRLIPRSENAAISGQLDCFVEYSRRIRKVKKVWGGTASVIGNSVYFKTFIDNSITGSRSFGYTIDYRGRQAANHPIFMDIRMATGGEFP